ncbi:MAG: hypothetical protein U9Q35_01140 [Pseudomonadota bacterium]|nr:hypothetical protein [Pseudomonadota bacterium]
MTDQQMVLLAEIQRLALEASRKTGRRVYHEVQGWGNGQVWSVVRALGACSKSVHQSDINIAPSGYESGLMSDSSVHTLAEQHDALEAWMSEIQQRQEVAA